MEGNCNGGESLDYLVKQNINKNLKSLSLEIMPTKEYLKDGIATAEMVLNFLKEKSRFRISREIHAGSNGKKTTIMNSDFDCVLFINDEQPPFEKVLDDFEDILILNTGIVDIRKSQYSLQFHCNYFEFDFLPAANFVEDTNLSGDALIDMQQEKALDKIKANPKKNRYAYSSALAEAQVRFMRRQSGFVNEMVRIAKWWYASVFLEEYISGAKSLIELVMVYAVRASSIPKNANGCLICFTKFLQLLEKFDSLNIQFEKEHKFSLHQPYKIKNQRPIVLEPTNPYNNLAKDWNKTEKAKRSKEALQKYAAVTIERLAKAVNIGKCSNGQSIMPMGVLFEPQPLIAPIKKYFKGYDFLCSFETGDIHLPGMKVRNDELMKIPQFAIELIYFKQFLLRAIKSFEASVEFKNASLKEIQTEIEKIIDTRIRNDTSTPWIPTTEDHEDFDLTLSIPLRTKEGPRIVEISWSEDNEESAN